MNSAYKLFITTQKRNTHCVSFPLTQKGQCEAEEMFDQMKAEPTVTKLLLCRVPWRLKNETV